MERIKAVVKKWGNSFGLILPKRIVDTEGLKEGTEIIITFEPNNKTKVKDIFGILKGKTRKSGKDDGNSEGINVLRRGDDETFLQADDNNFHSNNPLIRIYEGNICRDNIILKLVLVVSGRGNCLQHDNQIIIQAALIT